MIYLLLMTTAGSILFLGYQLWVKACGSFLSEGMKYKVLVLVLLLHVIPLMWLKGWYGDLLRFLLPRTSTPNTELLMDMAAIETSTASYKTPNYTLEIALAALWIIFAVRSLVKKCKKYYEFRRNLRVVSKAAIPDNALATVEKLRKEFHIWRKVKVICTNEKGGTCTIGVLRPLIILQDDFTDRELEWSLRHEMTHIARGDLIVKLLLELVECVYWFNPILNNTLNTFREHFELISESSCDERAIRGFTKEERAAYAKMIVRNTRRRPGVILSSAFADDREIVKERVNVIMNFRKIKRWEKIIAASLFVVLMLADSLVAFAYPNVYHVEETVTERAEREAKGTGFWTDGCYYETGYSTSRFEVLYDAEFISETGEITPVNTIQPNVFCLAHNWVSGYLQLHDKQPDGSCVVDIYHSERCTRCNTVTVGDWVNTIKCAVCPH